MFSQEQINELEAPLKRDAVRERSQGGRPVSYIESWHAISEANRIFSFDGWSSELTEVKCVSERECTIGKEKAPGWNISYIVRCKVSIGGPVGAVVREDVGAGHGIDKNIGLAHESAIKEAASDAQKRAFRTFGNQFGLALYDKDKTNVEPEIDVSRERFVQQCWQTIANMNGQELYDWWFSSEQKKQRRDFEVPQDEISRMTTRLGQKFKEVGFKPSDRAKPKLVDPISSGPQP